MRPVRVQGLISVCGFEVSNKNCSKEQGNKECPDGEQESEEKGKLFKSPRPSR